MSKLLIISVLVSLLLTGCVSSRQASKRVNMLETTETLRTEQGERETTQIIAKQAFTELEIFTIVDEFDSTQPVNPETGTPPLKRRETTTTKAQATETTNAETSTIETVEAKTESEQSRQTETNEDENKTTEIAKLNGSGWLISAILAMFLFAVLCNFFQKRIKNLLKPF